MTYNFEKSTSPAVLFQKNNETKQWEKIIGSVT